MSVYTEITEYIDRSQITMGQSLDDSISSDRRGFGREA